MSNILDKRVRIADLAGILAGLLILYFGGSYIIEKIQLRLPRPQLPPGSGAGPLQLPSGTMAPPVPQLMKSAMLDLVPGRRYGVALDTPALLPTSDNNVRAEAVKRGFSNVDVFTKPPPGWPGKTKSAADTWVVGFYTGAPQSLPRSFSTPTGSIDVIEAWEG